MQIPGYDVIAPLGRGGQASVFRALCQRGGGEVALKLFPIPRNEVVAGRFRREAESLRAIQDPGVVRVLDHGFAQGHPFLVLELVHGRSLSEAIVRGLSLDEVVEVAWQLARALRAVHAAGVTHRDVKPENVLLSNDRVVLVDFGLAHFVAGDAHSLTQSGALLGTPAYMAPELAAGNLTAVGPAADVYGWGATVFEAVSGRAPFTGETLVGLLRAVTEDRAPSLRALRPDTPRWLAQLVARCLAKPPRARPSDGAALVRAFERARAGRRAGRAGAGPWLGAAAGVLLGLAVWAAWPTNQADPPPSATQARPATPPPATGRYTVELRLDPLSGRDAYVDGFELYTNDNFGADLGIMTGVRKRGSSSAPRLGFVAFPLEQLPPGAEIESATLELSSDPRPLEFALEVYRVLGPWVEGANGLDDSLDGVAWGEGPQPLNDPGFARPTLEARPLSRFDGAPVPARWDVTAAARAWLADPASNHGLCVAPTLSEAEVAELEDGSHYRSFRSRDSSSTRERPCLRVTYRGAAPRAPEPYAVRLAAHRAETAAALRAASRLAPDARLTRITELLVAVPSDVELRCARIRTLLELGRFEDAIHECTALERTHSAPYPPVAMEAAAQILREPRLAAEVRRADKLWLVWKTYWSLLDAEHVPVEVHPPRDFRLSALQTRIMVYDEFELVVEHYRRGLALWPGARELQEEFAALPELCLQIARALREQPATVERGRRVAAEALRALPCTLVQARELEQLAR